MTAIVDEPEFGQYELLAKAGEGPRGPVFVARTRGDVRAELLHVVALSTFATGEDEPMRAFVRDVEYVAQLRHPNLIGVVDIGINTLGHYVVMDHVEGATLSALQDRHRASRPPRLVVTPILDALYGLHAAHSIREDGVARPLIHGSISPDHLIIGLDGTCRVAGFGNVPRIQTRPSHRSRTAFGYMAPEQLTGAATDPRTDVFAVGVVLWNALTGKRLFHDRIDHLTMSNVLERTIPRPSTIGLGPPPALDAVVMKALERDPAHRFRSAAEMANALGEAAREAGCLAQGPEVSAWIATTFGGELATRARLLRERAARVVIGTGVLPTLPPLGAPAPDSAARDELSADELARATGPLPLLSAPTLSPIAASRSPEPRRHRRLAIVAAASFAVVASVLGWRWSATASVTGEGAAVDPRTAPPAAGSPLPIELEVTVLEVRPASPLAPAPAPAPPPAIAVAAALPRTVATALPAPPSRTPPRAKRPQHVTAPARSEARVDQPETKPAEPVVEAAVPRPAPAKPESPPRPALDANPYLYK
jgi:eukaryotic-like serine/threonine-protein kinase